MFHKLSFRWNTILFLILLSFFVGTISAFSPFYLFALVLFMFFIYYFYHDINNTFLYMFFLLLLQPIVSYNIDVLGIPLKIRTALNRMDEVVWFFFLFVLLAKSFHYNRWIVRRTGLEIPAALFLVNGILSMIINRTNFFWSVIAMLLALKGIIIYMVAINLNFTIENVITFYKRVFYFFLLAFFIGLLQFLGVNIPLLPEQTRLGVKVASSIFGHHAIFGLVMAIGYSLTTGIYLANRKKKWIVLSIAFLLGIIISSVRKSLLGIILGTLFVFLNHRALRINKRDIYAGVGLMLILFAIFYNRFSDLIQGTQREYVRNVEVSPRFLLYYGAFRILQNKPLTGEGPGRYGSYVSVVTKSNIYRKYGVEMPDRFKVDTYWAYIAGEYGIPGILFIILILAALFKNLFALARQDITNDLIRGLIIGNIMLFVEFFVESPTIGIYKLSLPAFVLFGGTGILECLIYYKDSGGPHLLTKNDK